MTETEKQFEKKKTVCYSLPPSLTKKISEAAKTSDVSASTEVKRRLEWSFKKEAK